MKFPIVPCCVFNSRHALDRFVAPPVSNPSLSAFLLFADAWLGLCPRDSPVAHGHGARCLSRVFPNGNGSCFLMKTLFLYR